MIHVVILSTVDITIQGLIGVLSGDGIEITGITDDVDKLKVLVEKKMPDVAIIDTQSLPFPTADELKRRCDIFGELSKRMGLVTFAEFGSKSRFELARLAGIKGYCLNTIKSADLINAVKTAALGETYVHKGFAEQVNKDDSPSIRDLRRLLTKRQAQIFDLILMGYTNEQIAETLYLSIPTVKSHTSAILKKLGVRERSQIISKALNNLITEIGKQKSGRATPPLEGL